MKPYVADVFSGSGRVAAAVRRLGGNAEEWELKRGRSHDMLDWRVEKDFH